MKVNRSVVCVSLMVAVAAVTGSIITGTFERTETGFDSFRNATAKKLYVRGLTEWNSTDSKSALRDLNETLRLEPNKFAYLVRAACRCSLADNTGALADFDQALKL